MFCPAAASVGAACTESLVGEMCCAGQLHASLLSFSAAFKHVLQKYACACTHMHTCAHQRGRLGWRQENAERKGRVWLPGVWAYAPALQRHLLALGIRPPHPSPSSLSITPATRPSCASNVTFRNDRLRFSDTLLQRRSLLKALLAAAQRLLVHHEGRRWSHRRRGVAAVNVKTEACGASDQCLLRRA